ncbi:MAG: hypothetical protein ACD_2C00200G0002 [uncultured bacterium (gcode 4)]|uniref:Uncharacterized protein n=1 Tax=uncultured bacterium (gcode 4) TaxID=1234023 RepID=K2FDR2_9BACT|nr:MAG: hypothetical protein ACD_2C00200G0002 [uncultured bacterium (gcode 4)]
MKKLVSFLSATILAASSFSWAFAATGSSSAAPAKTAASSSKVDHFEVTTNPASAKIGEAIDVTVKAVDKDWNVKKDYAWTIYITVDNDTKATIPYSDGYQFTAADLGQKTFSKWLSFTKEWKMKVIVLDIDNDQLEWAADVTVWAGSGWSWTTSWGDITITSPDNGMTVAEGKVTISWSTKKNSKITFYLNWAVQKDIETQSDDKGTFVVEMKNITQSTNVIQVKVLDWSDKVIAESEKINVTVESNWPLFKDLKVTQGTEVPAGSVIDVTATADPGLTEFNAAIGDSSTTLTEITSSPGTYSWTLTVPSLAWDYQIDVNLKNSLGKTTDKKWVVSLKAIESNIFKNVKSIVSDKKVSFTFELTQDKSEYAKFKFIYGTSPDTLKTAWDTQNKESVTFEKDKIKSASGWYSWYISGLDPSVGKYYFQLQPLDKDGKQISWIQSDIVEVDFSLSSAGWKCMISNVGWLKAIKNWEVVDLTWDTLPEASSYNVYKKWTDWTFTLIENVPLNKYTLNISWDKVKFEDFAIKAVCWDWESKSESQDYSNATKVQTWPAQIMLLLWISLAIWFFFVRRRYAK